MIPTNNRFRNPLSTKLAHFAIKNTIEKAVQSSEHKPLLVKYVDNPLAIVGWITGSPEEGIIFFAQRDHIHHGGAGR